MPGTGAGETASGTSAARRLEPGLRGARQNRRMAAKYRPRRSDRRVQRRIAATAATAAIALSPAAAAARPSTARTPLPTRPGGDPVERLAQSDQAEATLALDASRRAEMADHRRHLAGALAAELHGPAAAEIERAIGVAEEDLSDAYSRGERPRFVARVGIAEVHLGDSDRPLDHGGGGSVKLGGESAG